MALHKLAAGVPLFQRLIEAFSQKGDMASGRKAAKLEQKGKTGKPCIAICGYTSAGKSQLANHLTGQNLLPVSPLPSSMNTVHIRPGQPLLAMGSFEQITKAIPAPSAEQISAASQEKSAALVELTYPLACSFELLDTPGVDSPESAAALTENPELLLADLVIYVTDYNHVQSEINFSCLRNLQEQGIPFWLVVNQIDKHAQWELSLDEFRAKLEQALRQWNLCPMELFFTSLAQPNCDSNQLELLTGALHSLDWPQFLSAALTRSVKAIIKQHGNFVADLNQGQREPYLWALRDSRDDAELARELEGLELQISCLSQLAETIEAEIMAEIAGLLENAPLFSFETRELARLFLESRQPGFKAGIFAGSRKTEETRTHRLNTFQQELSERSEAHIAWHLRQILASIPARYGLAQDPYTEEVWQIQVVIRPELLLQTINPGAIASNGSLLNYCKDLAAAIKLEYRRTALKWIARACALAESRCRLELPAIKELQHELRQTLEARTKLGEMAEADEKYLAELSLPWSQITVSGPKPLQPPRVHRAENTPASKPTVRPLKVQKPKSEAAAAPKAAHPRLKAAAMDLKATSSLVESIPGFDTVVSALLQRAERLDNSLFTVALFGAFSAGKSSLANALLGDSILPVSPNPTTAAINKILPPNGDFPHGSVRIRLKTLEDLTADVLASLEVLNLRADGLDSALALLVKHDAARTSPQAKPHLAFLQAVNRGLPAHKQYLGQEILVDFPTFREYIVEESKACLVEWIELYYDCPLTSQGVILVDTPGSNSTNARHTDVAFDYIKNADAVLFVTYYNNAFCKADARFLSQLGKVKDAFELDKMFFLINAADLAQSAEELDQVVLHVKQNLVSCGVHHPRVYPVSSQLALLAKLSSKNLLASAGEQLFRQRLGLDPAAQLPPAGQVLDSSGFAHFEGEFHTFLSRDLVQIALNSARSEIRRTLGKVEGLLEAARAGDAEKARLLRECQALQQAVLAALSSVSPAPEANSLAQEVDELFYYVNQRLSHRFAESFNRSFFILARPKDAQPKDAPLLCLQEFAQDMESELAQEIRATFVRLERFHNKLLSQLYGKLSAAAAQLDPNCTLGEAPIPPGLPKASLPAWEGFSGAEKNLSLYRGPKDWIGGGGRERLLQGLQKKILPSLNSCLSSLAREAREVWGEVFSGCCAKLSKNAQAEVSSYFAAMAAALSLEIEVSDLEQIKQGVAEHIK